MIIVMKYMDGVCHRELQLNHLKLPQMCLCPFIVDRSSILTIKLKYDTHFFQLISSLLPKIWCAVGIDLTGSNSTSDSTSVDPLNKQLIESYHQMIDEQCLKLSSIVWIAAKLNNTAMIAILDSNQSEKILEKFPLGNAIIYAMGSIPGLEER